MAKTARDIMSPECHCIGETDTVLDAAERLAELDVGSMPICGRDNRLKGMVTDRDIVVKVIARGLNPATTPVSDLATQGEVVTIGADDGVGEVLRTMTEHKVRRLPVIDGHECVGMVSQADVAAGLEQAQAGDLVRAISAAP